MPRVALFDGTRVSYRVEGSGPPLLCVPGGPGRAASYLEDLGGLSDSRTLVLVDLPGTGASDPPTGPEGFSGRALADGLDVICADAGAERLPVLGHSAGGWVALAFSLAHPERVAALVFVTTAVRGVVPDAEAEAAGRAVADTRADEPWYAEAIEAADAEQHAPRAERARLAALQRPFFYARWDDRARAHAARADREVDQRAAASLRAAGRAEAPDLRARLAEIAVPALVLAGALDTWPAPPVARAFAAALPEASYAELPGAAHFPWLDDPGGFRRTVGGFLAGRSPDGVDRVEGA